MDRTDVTAGVRDIDDALGDYLEASEYVTGNVPEVFASNRIRKIIARTGDRYKFALASTPVRVLTNRVQLTGVTTGTETGDQLIASVRAANLMQLLEPEVHAAMFEFGDAYLFSWPIFDDTDQVTGLKVLYHSPETVRAIYSDDDPTLLLHVIRSWTEGTGDQKVRRADLYYDATTDDTGQEQRARIERWTTLPGADAKGHTPDAWTHYVEDEQEDWLIEHDYGMPWSHFRNGTPYGTPEHALAYGCQDAITKMLITQLTTTDSHGWPQRYGLVAPEAVLDQNTDDPDWEDDADADDTGAPIGGVSTGERTGPGTMQTLTGMAEVGQFQAADPSVFMTPVDVYVRLMAQLTDTPLWDFDPAREQPSGVSRQRAEAPLIAKILHREAYLTATWTTFWARALALLGQPDPITVALSWAPAYRIDDVEGLQALEAKRNLGVPVEHLLIEAGYTTEQAADWATAAPPTDQQLYAAGQIIDTAAGGT